MADPLTTFLVAKVIVELVVAAKTLMAATALSAGAVAAAAAIPVAAAAVVSTLVVTVFIKDQVQLIRDDIKGLATAMLRLGKTVSQIQRDQYTLDRIAMTRGHLRSLFLLAQ